jgi:2',3'-cyclic-nucleotide 2'-phosphodiesterase / 3'-nucleotidase / 5'-nucleotidase
MQLKLIMEEDAAAYEKREFRGIWGLRWVFDPSGSDGQRVLTLTRSDGTPLKFNERLEVAFNSYELASGGLRWLKLRELADLSETKLVEYDVQVREAVINYIQSHGTVSPVTNGWWRAARQTNPITGR